MWLVAPVWLASDGLVSASAHISNGYLKACVLYVLRALTLPHPLIIIHLLLQNKLGKEEGWKGERERERDAYFKFSVDSVESTD